MTIFVILLFAVCLPVTSNAKSSDCSKLLSVRIAIDNRPEPFIPANSLDEATQIAKKYDVVLTDKFQSLSSARQLKYLNEVNRAYAAIPPLILAIIRKAHFKLHLVVDSASNVPELAESWERSDDAYAGLTQPGQRTVYVVVNRKMDSGRDRLAEVVMHELGHSFDWSLASIMAGMENQPDGLPRYSYAQRSTEFAAANRLGMTYLSGAVDGHYKSKREHFAETFRLYLLSKESRKRLLEILPDTYVFFQNLIGPLL